MSKDNMYQVLEKNMLDPGKIESGASMPIGVAIAEAWYGPESENVKGGVFNRNDAKKVAAVLAQPKGRDALKVVGVNADNIDVSAAPKKPVTTAYNAQAGTAKDVQSMLEESVKNRQEEAPDTTPKNGGGPAR